MLGEPHLLFKRQLYPLQIMLVCASKHAAYPLSLRHIDEMMKDRGFFIDHAAVRR